MSKMAELDWEIELRVCEGMDAGDIASELNIPLSWVLNWQADNGISTKVDASSWDEIEDPHVVDISPYATINS
jgi:hypothetical protein